LRGLIIYVLTMKCNLCLKETVLIKKSHIIPDFMYNGIYDEDHFIYKLDLIKPEKSGKNPTGVYDKHILCSNCDNKVIGTFESYASKLLFGGKMKMDEMPLFETIAPETMMVKNINYAKFKLFLLSILWRSHVSSNKFFSQIDLGPYAEIIRKMIVDSDPGDEEQFETCIIYYNEKALPSKSIVTPRKIKYNGNTSYHFLINHMSIWFNISNQSKLELFKHSGLKPNNTMAIYVAQGEKAKELFKKSTGLHFELK